mmetsp:Transcript_51608/g.122935  ORF Transcript_51608/g.122935 Transcript_51608/m.122935 type:complete len:389 (-) Transcript_51608:336-1502(-)
MGVAAGILVLDSIIIRPETAFAEEALPRGRVVRAWAPLQRRPRLLVLRLLALAHPFHELLGRILERRHRVRLAADVGPHLQLARLRVRLLRLVHWVVLVALLLLIVIILRALRRPVRQPWDNRRRARKRMLGGERAPEEPSKLARGGEALSSHAHEERRQRVVPRDKRQDERRVALCVLSVHPLDRRPDSGSCIHPAEQRLARVQPPEERGPVQWRPPVLIQCLRARPAENEQFHHLHVALERSFVQGREEVRMRRGDVCPSFEEQRRQRQVGVLYCVEEQLVEMRFHRGVRHVSAEVVRKGLEKGDGGRVAHRLGDVEGLARDAAVEGCRGRRDAPLRAQRALAAEGRQAWLPPHQVLERVGGQGIVALQRRVVRGIRGGVVFPPAP